MSAVSAPSTTWVLLRGLVREQRHWGDFPKLFQDGIPDAQTVTLDLPGNGTLYREASPTHIEDMAQFCRAELQTRGFKPPYHLLALSLGAMVAVAWSKAAPEEIDACVLINTSLRPFDPFHRRLRPHNYGSLLRCLFAAPRQRERLIMQMTSCRGDAQAALLEQWVAWQSQYPVSPRNALRQLWAAMRFRAPQQKPCARMLVLGSLRDQLVDNQCSQDLARRWQADSAFHPGAGHDLPLDDGPWIVGQVEAWIKAGQ
ncbi:MAG TPA: alpha/beta hydrolase [Burkholderiaceae bacterium]|jgi:pimeloyl-ACP methyl ester carboxylesterase